MLRNLLGIGLAIMTGALYLAVIALSVLVVIRLLNSPGLPFFALRVLSAVLVVCVAVGLTRTTLGPGYHWFRFRVLRNA